ncbi:MAG: hypothetical protein IPG04_10065 [Polyangiaceae bacterium]|nr:hypothetical protein [Polyangiaceae bacterium]
MREQSPGVGASWGAAHGRVGRARRWCPRRGSGAPRVAVATLRSLGLAEVLLHTDDGYLVDPTVTLRTPSGPEL